jgi:signal transduction histidine kinase
VDSGIGMTEEEIGKAFKDFSQGEHFNADIPSRYGGLGLGLAITHTLVNMHGGNIRAESAGRNQGSTFVLEFPIFQEPGRRNEITNAENSIQNDRRHS